MPAIFGAKGLAKEAAQIGGDISRKASRNAIEGAGQSAGLKEGDKIYRVYGGDSKADGASWTSSNPAEVADFRDAAGLPSGGESGAVNSGSFVIEATLMKPDAVVKTRKALPLDGKRGGMVEHIIPNPISSGAVRVDRVSGANPEF